MYEVFDPTNGRVMYRVPRFIARLITWRSRLDYARPGEGWI